MVCQELTGNINSSISSILSYPSTCVPQFWGEIMGAFFIILTMILFNRDKDKYLKSDMISAMGVSSIATIFVSLIGTLIGIIQNNVFIEIFVVGTIFIIIWLLKK